MSHANSPGVELEYLSWKDAESLFAKDPVVVIPIGAQTKEHGFHLPLNTDWLTARYLTKRILDVLPVVCLPVVPYGYYPAFTEYPGSVSIQSATFRDTILDICRSIARHGPRRIYALNTGVSTSLALKEAAAILSKEKIVLSYTDILVALGDTEKKIAEQARGTHADEIETSMMLYLAPEVVRIESAVKDDAPELVNGPLTRDPKAARGVYSPSGAWGDPTLATKEKGKILIEALVTHILDSLRKLGV